MPLVSSSLKILLAIGNYDPQEGGAAEWVKNYALWLLERGHQVTIVCGRSRHAAPEGCALLALPASEYSENPWEMAVALQSMIEKVDFDIVHDTGCLPKADVFHPLMGSLTHNWLRQLWAYPPKERLRKPWLVRMWRDARLQRSQCKYSRTVIATSKRAAADLGKFNCQNPSIIHNGIRPLESRPGSTETTKNLRRALGAEGRTLVLMTATNFYLKGVMTVLRALEIMDSELRRSLLVVVAGQNQETRFPKYIARHRLHDACILTGWVDGIDDYYRAADIFLHPTYHDGGSLSTLKALSAGCAVVSSQFDGSADYIQDGQNGIVIERPDDPREIVRALERLSDPKRRSRLGLEARRLASAVHQERQFEQIEAFYRQHFSLRPDLA